MSDALPAELGQRFRGATVIGEGAFGRVLRARDATLDREVAIKVMAPEVAGEEEHRARFLREARLTAGIKSPHVAAVYDFGVAGDAEYIVFEFIDGPNLRAYTRQMGGRLPLADAAKILDEILEGLTAVHALGVVHRDLKPENVLLSPEGRAVLVDFGLGRTRGPSGITKQGTVVGTALYMCPEGMRGEQPQLDWDLYAAAVLFRVLVTGRSPFPGESYAELYAAKLDGPPGSLAEEGLRVPAALDHLLARMLAPASAERARSASLARAALQEALAPTATTPRGRIAPRIVRRPPDPLESRAGEDTAALSRVRAQSRAMRPDPWRLRLASAGVATLLAAGAGFWMGPGTGPPSARPVEARRPAGGGGPGAATADGPRAAGPGSPEAAAGAEGLRAAWLGRAEVRAALALTDRDPPEQVLGLWREAREALSDQGPRVEAALEAGPPGAAPVAWASAIGDLATIAHLLSVARGHDPAPLFPGARQPDFGAALARVVQVRRAPRLDGWIGDDPEARVAAGRQALEGGGRRWRTVRRLEDCFQEVDGVQQLVATVARSSFFGDTYFDVTQSWPDVLQAGAQRIVAGSVLLASPARLEAPLEPAAGDLVLATAVGQLDETVVLVLELMGRDETLRVPLEPPRDPRPQLSAGRQRLTGVALRVRADFLPAGLRRLRLVARGIEPIGSPTHTVHVEEIHQLLEGRPPVDFEAAPPRR